MIKESTQRWLKRGFVTLALVLLIATALALHRVGAMADRLALRLACPTVFVEGRSLDTAVEKLRTLGLLPVDITRFVSLDLDRPNQRLSATAFFVVRRQSVYYSGEGCVLQ